MSYLSDDMEEDQIPKIIALIPARGNSKRIPKKNIKSLSGHPLIAYTISAAKDSGIFSRIIVSTEDENIAAIARKYGAEVPFLRPLEYSGDKSVDFDWIEHLLNKMVPSELDENYTFSILRPTSPFRKPETIKRAWEVFCANRGADSLRAIEKCSQHPAKMWYIKNNESSMEPVMMNPNLDETPWHSQPYQNLPKIYVQNASLEIAHVRTVLSKRSISGERVIPFVTKEYEGFDINLSIDWYMAEYLVREGIAKLPEVKKPQALWKTGLKK